MIRVFPVTSPEAKLLLANQGFKGDEFLYLIQKFNVTHVADFFNPRTKKRVYDAYALHEEQEMKDTIQHFFDDNARISETNKVFTSTDKVATIAIPIALSIEHGVNGAKLPIFENNGELYVPLELEAAMITFSLQEFTREVLGNRGEEVINEVLQELFSPESAETEVHIPHNRTIH